ncbi:MAG: hypothetical protein JSV62_14065 [Promethearchaeota archaeon]|nr:MAG: hypothetical protein JSV62_14065 [Candidatus Lokiarchaeota archaeon]
MIEESFDDLSAYSEERLQNIAHDQIWRGSGTEIDPFVVQNANILGQAILIRKSSLYLSFINCNFNHAQFEGCKNILFENCAFNKLVLKKCKKFKIEGSFVTDLNFKSIRDVLFSKSIILNVSNKFRIKNTVFNDCQLNNDFLDYILKKSRSGFYSKIKEVITAIIIIFSFMILYRFMFMFSVFNFVEVMNLLLFAGIIIGLLIFLLFSLIYEYGIKKRHPRIKILSTE